MYDCVFRTTNYGIILLFTFLVNKPTSALVSTTLPSQNENEKVLKVIVLPSHGSREGWHAVAAVKNLDRPQSPLTLNKKTQVFFPTIV